MENTEAIVQELNQLVTDSKEELPKLLEDYLVSIAKTGNTLLPWSKLRTLFRLKLEAVIREFQEASPVDLVPKMPNVEPFRFEEMRQRIFEQGRLEDQRHWVGNVTVGSVLVFLLSCHVGRRVAESEPLFLPGAGAVTRTGRFLL